jgi:hypothetical protein
VFIPDAAIFCRIDLTKGCVRIDVIIAQSEQFKQLGPRQLLLPICAFGGPLG